MNLIEMTPTELNEFAAAVYAFKPVFGVTIVTSEDPHDVMDQDAEHGKNEEWEMTL
jgi:hypothetical protein